MGPEALLSINKIALPILDSKSISKCDGIPAPLSCHGLPTCNLLGAGLLDTEYCSQPPTSKCLWRAAAVTAFMYSVVGGLGVTLDLQHRIFTQIPQEGACQEDSHFSSRAFLTHNPALVSCLTCWLGRKKRWFLSDSLGEEGKFNWVPIGKHCLKVWKLLT